MDSVFCYYFIYYFQHDEHRDFICVLNLSEARRGERASKRERAREHICLFVRLRETNDNV